MPRKEKFKEYNLKTKITTIRIPDLKDLNKEKELRKSLDDFVLDFLNLKANTIDKYKMLLEERTILVQGYTMLNEFFMKLTENAEKIISDFGLMTELINKHINIDKLKKLNWTLGLE